MNRAIPPLLTALFACLLALPSPSLAERVGDDGVNVWVRLGLSDGEQDRTIQALVLDGQRVRTTAGWRVPTVMTLSRESASGAHGATYEYQNVGLGVTLQVRIVESGRIRVSGELDLGAIERDEPAASEAGKTPTVETFRHVFDVIVVAGDGVRLAEVPKPDGGSAILTLVADVQR